MATPRSEKIKIKKVEKDRRHYSSDVQHVYSSLPHLSCQCSAARTCPLFPLKGPLSHYSSVLHTLCTILELLGRANSQWCQSLCRVGSGFLKDLPTLYLIAEGCFPWSKGTRYFFLLFLGFGGFWLFFLLLLFRFLLNNK